MSESRTGRSTSRWLLLVVAVALSLLAVPGLTGRSLAQSASSLVPTAVMSLPRSHFTATLLPGGMVLVAGGESQSGPFGAVTSSAELYDPTTGHWLPARGMSTPRTDFTATLLPDGRVLVAGGTDGTSYLASAELYDPATDTWSSAGTMSAARSNHTATLLNNGRVLVVGGSGPTGPLSSVELYDPTTNSWSTTDSLRVARSSQAAVRLKNGTVLVTGGIGVDGPLSSVEIYDPGLGRWLGFLPLPSMLQARFSHTATLLTDGRVLVAGGFSIAGSLSSAELFDPQTEFWSSTGSMSTARALHRATLLDSGQVLVTGGELLSGGIPTTLDSAELYDPQHGTWAPAGSMSVPRYAHTATLLGNGAVLLAGGANGAAYLSSADLYVSGAAQPPTATPAIVPSLPPAPPTATTKPVALEPTATRTPTPLLSPTATSTPTPRPTSPSTPVTGLNFRILGVRVEKHGAKPDFGVKYASLRNVSVGTKARLSLYVKFNLVGGIARVTYTAQVTHAGKVVFRGKIQRNRTGSGEAWIHWPFTARQPGSYVFAGRVSANNIFQQVTVSFAAVPVHHPVSFSFDRLSTADARGRPASSFAITSRVFIHAGFTIHTVNSRVPVTVATNLQAPQGRGWKALGRSVENSFDAVSGANSYTVSFVPQTPYSRLRMVISITVAGKTKSRSVVFRVHR